MSGRPLFRLVIPMHNRIAIALATALFACTGAAHAQTTPAPQPGGGVFHGRGMQGALGFSYRIVTAGVGEQAFPVVIRLVEGSPAAVAGIRIGDRIMAVNGRDGREDALFPQRAPGTRYTVRIRRDGEEREIEFTLAPPPTQPGTPAPPSPPGARN